MRSACAPGQTTDRSVKRADREGDPIQRPLQLLAKVAGLRRTRQISAPSKSLIAESTDRNRVNGPVEQTCELSIVAKDRVRIERQVIAIQIEFSTKNGGEAQPFRADDARVFSAPKPPMVYQDRIGTGGDGSL